MRNLILALIIIAIGIFVIQQHKPPEPGPQPLPGISENYEAKAPANVPDDAWKYYEHAKDAVYQSDLTRAESDLSNAVRIKPDFTEAWYNLGATQARIAINLTREHHEHDAVLMFRKGVGSKKKARDLMIQGKWFEYEGQDRIQVRNDVEMALADADEVINDDVSLIKALWLWAGATENQN